MSVWEKIIAALPEVEAPDKQKLSFKEKMKWTLIILITFFILGLIPLFGLGTNALQQFEFLSVILGAEFGSLISLGIGPIVTASIILQLLNGSGIINFDLTSREGKMKFQGWQKLLTIGFIIFEAIIYVVMGGLSPLNHAGVVQDGTGLFYFLELLIIVQLTLGGFVIVLMDEVISKWGFGSGVSLFIAAGVSKSIFIRALSPLPSPNNPEYATGAIPSLFQALGAGDPQTALLMIAGIIATIIVFGIAVYIQAMKVEIPLSFGRVRGHGIRWPLNFAYANVIPVILVSALLANIQLWARLLENWGRPWLGTFAGNAPSSGVVYWVQAPNLVEQIIQQGSLMIGWNYYLQALIFLSIMVGGCAVFSVFWVQTSGMDARSQAKQISASGLQIPGFRKDERIIERLLKRYISPLTVMGGMSIGFLAGIADLLGALSQGTALLLAVMIIYKLYEELAKQHMYDMHPMMRKFMDI